MKKVYTLPFTSSFYPKIKFQDFGELAITSETYTTHKSYKRHLYVKEKIHIAIDGEINDMDDFHHMNDKIFTLYHTFGKDALYNLKGKFW